MSESPAKAAKKPSLYPDLAETPEDILESQRLRYRVFAGELGAKLPSADKEIDEDRFDPYCHHLLVRESTNDRIVGSTRLLTDEQAAKAGSFYSASEFDIAPILALDGLRLEVGRTCIDPKYRSGAAIAVLWSGLASFVALNGFDYLFGCASIELDDGGGRARNIMQRLREGAMNEQLDVHPRRELPPPSNEAKPTASMPPLLKAYVRLGAQACGEPCWDPEFNVADVLMLLDVDKLDPAYSRHFLERASKG